MNYTIKKRMSLCLTWKAFNKHLLGVRFVFSIQFIGFSETSQLLLFMKHFNRCFGVLII